MIRELHVKSSLAGPHLDGHQKLLFDKTVLIFWRIANLLELDLSTFSFACADDILKVQQDFARQIRDQDWKSHHAAIRKWKQKLRISSRTDRRAVHRWIKGGFTGAAKLMKHGKTLTGSVPTMLNVIAERMGAIYNKYQGVDPSEMLDNFLLKYRLGIQDTFRECKLPFLTPHDFFDACQKKPACKASGLDQWRYKDLQQLPPKGWIPFHLVAVLAEATGQWPQVFRCVSVTCIPKNDSPILDPDSIRAIGVSCVVYSLWSSVRFHHLSHWMNDVAPPGLLGGLPKRTTDLSEIQFSHTLHEHDGDESQKAVAIFIDRLKCFDLVIPQVAIGIAKSVGLPPLICRAVLGFYTDQVKCFKIGSFFSGHVLSCNAAVQGCSMSVMIVNVMYSILVRSLQRVVPQVSISTFTDDCKIWGFQQFTHQVVEAFEYISEFDQSIGQVLNDKKSQVLVPTKQDARKIRKMVGRPIAVARQVKSLGRVHQSCNTRDPTLQRKRVHSAIDTLSRIRSLPIPADHRASYVQIHGHSKWIFGTETQGVSIRDIRALRTAVVNVLDPSNNKIRSPALILATQKDPFLDPLSKWIFHILWGLRKISKKDPAAACGIFQKAYSTPVPKSGAVNGHHRILRFVLEKIQWSISDPADLRIQTPAGSFRIIDFSDAYFRELIGDAVRLHILSLMNDRYEKGEIPPRSCINVFLTRFLSDNSFKHEDIHSIIEPLLARIKLKTREHVKNYIQQALSGRIFTAPRLCAAKLAKSRLCPFCGQVETHHHLFATCDHYRATRPCNPPIQPSLSWNTGIIFTPVSPIASNLPTIPVRERIAPSNTVFVDGSCFFFPIKELRTATAAYLVPGQTKCVINLDCSDVNSLRAEIVALLLVLRHFCGIVELASDCLEVVRGMAAIISEDQRANFLNQCDNQDLWTCICDAWLEFPGKITVFKVKAHVKDGDPTQSHHLTSGNAAVDELARSAAKRLADGHSQRFHNCVYRAVDLQTHIVSTLAIRAQVAENGGFDVGEGEDEIHAFPQPTTFVCNCAPRTRCKGKISICRGTCCDMPSLQTGSIEDTYCHACRSGTLTWELVDKISTHYCVFTNRFVGYPQPRPSFENVVIDMSPSLQKLSIGRTMLKYFQRAKVHFSPTRDGIKVPWLLVFVDFCSLFPETVEWFDHWSVHHNVCKFRRAAVAFLKDVKHEFQLDDRSKICSEFGFSQLKGFYGMFCFSIPSRAWFLLAALSLKNLQRDFGSHSLFSIRDELDHLALIPQSVGQR